MLAEPLTAVEMGREGFEIYRASDISWDRVVDTLTS